LRVAFLGPAGTFAEEALRASAPAGVEEIPYPSIFEAVMAVQSRAADRAVVPIENSIEGSVNATLDALAHEATGVRIVEEVDHPVHQTLIAADGIALDEVTRVMSHPQATAQCQRFIAAELPGAEIVSTASTAEADGLQVDRDLLPLFMKTANGVIPARSATVDTLRLGTITARVFRWRCIHYRRTPSGSGCRRLRARAR